MAIQIRSLFEAMLGIVIGLGLLPVVVGFVNDMNTTGMSGAVVALVNLIPLFYVFLLIGGAVGYVIVTFKSK